LSTVNEFSPVDYWVTTDAVIRKILLHAQSRAPPRGGLSDATLPGTDAQFTLAG
jgi:hypothetical protein